MSKYRVLDDAIRGKKISIVYYWKVFHYNKRRKCQFFQRWFSRYNYVVLGNFFTIIKGEIVIFFSNIRCNIGPIFGPKGLLLPDPIKPAHPKPHNLSACATWKVTWVLNTSFASHSFQCGMSFLERNFFKKRKKKLLYIIAVKLEERACIQPNLPLC